MTVNATEPFEHGYMKAPLTLAPGDLEIVIVEDRRAPLSAFGDIRGRVISQVGSQAWWIDSNAVAHWIPDGATWACLDGANLLTAENVPGWTVASFEQGENASCE
jgi:hypothetical protein